MIFKPEKNFKYQREKLWKKTILRERTKLKIVLMLFSCVFVASFIYIGVHFYDVIMQERIEKHIGDLFEQAKQDRDITGTEDIFEDDITGGEPGESDWERERRLLLEREAEGRIIFADILAINPDFLGMIEIPGLLSPIPYVHESDDIDYLNTDFYGNRNRHGTIYMSKYNDRLMMDNNTVFYGHYLTSGGMFTNLHRYKEASAFEKYPIVKLDGLIGESTWIVFAAHVTEPRPWFAVPYFDRTLYAAHLDEIKARSLFITDVDVTTNDRIITLVVCDYTYEDMRFLVHARKLRPGESVPSEVIAVPNPERKDFEVLHQQTLSSVKMTNAAFVQSPMSQRFFFYQFSQGKIDRFSGNSHLVQGPFTVLRNAGIPANGYASALVLNSRGSNETTRGLYFAVQGMNNEVGITLYTGESAFDAFRLEKRITPDDVDARFPLLQEYGGAIWLFYSVPGAESSYIYRQRLQNEDIYGDPELVYIVEGITNARPLGYYPFYGTTIFIWHDTDNDRVTVAPLDGESEIYDIFIGFGENSRVILFGTYSGESKRFMRERNGIIVFGTLDFNVPTVDDPSGEDENNGDENGDETSDENGDENGDENADENADENGDEDNESPGDEINNPDENA
ncbi:MAG: sortase [Oscillospiraceae bacterium]|jgi:sortase B|nr:sortase [Oscillospiraceae bacterium]